MLSEILAKLTTLSPNASKLIDDELYKIVTIMDNASRQSLLKECMLCLNEDLTELGIYVITDLDDLFENNYELNRALDVLSYVFPTTLIPKLRNDDTLFRLIENLLNSDLSDDPFITSYLDQLGGLTTQGYSEDLTQGCMFLNDKLTSDSTLNKIMSSSLKLSSNNSLRSELSHKESIEYTKFVKEFINSFYDCYVILNNKLQIDNKEQIFNRLMKRLKITRSVFINPKNQNIFYFIFVYSKETKAEKQLFMEKRKNVFCLLKLHPYYFSCRNKPVDVIDILGFVCFYYGFGKFAKTNILQERLNEFVTRYPDHKELLTTLKSFFNQ